MTKPKSLKIFGQKYTIRYDYESDENTGLTSPDKNLIQIAPGLPPSKTFRILMHEATHAIIGETVLRGRKRFEEEEICDIVGFHFIDMLKDNPAIMEWLLKEVEE